MQGIFIALNGMPEVTPGNTNKPSFTTFKMGVSVSCAGRIKHTTQSYDGTPLVWGI